MDSIGEALVKGVENGTFFLIAIISFIIKEPLKKLLMIIGGWISEGSNLSLLRKVLPPMERKLDEKLTEVKNQFNSEIDKINIKIERICNSIDNIKTLVERDLKHSKNNLIHIEQGTKDLIQQLLDKLDEKK